MSDIPTPRTAEALEIERLERELADAKREIDELSRSIRQQQLMDEEILGLRERIRRLTEAGDALAVWVSPEYETDPANAALKEWNQAKEAKP